MESQTLRLPGLSILSAILLLSFASAGVLEIGSLGYSSSASHNSDVVVSFNVAYSGTLATTTVYFNESTASTGSWTSLPSPLIIANDSNPVSLSATLHVPEHATGVVSAILKAKISTTSDSEPITITILNSPAVTVSNIQSLTKTQNGTIKVENTGNVYLSDVVLSSLGDFNVSLSSNHLSLSAGSSASVNVNALEDLNELNLGTHSVQLTAKDTSTNATGTFSYSVSKDFCEEGNRNSTKIKITNLEDKSSDTEWEWKPLDEIEIGVEIENILDDDEDFIVQLALYDTEDEDFVELEGDDVLEQEVSIDEDDSVDVTFEFQLPVDVEDSNGRYVLYVKAYLDGDEDTYCNSYEAEDVPDSETESIEINKEEHEIFLGEISSSDSVRPGDTVTLSARAFNIGNSDEDKVKVELTNTKLGLDLESSSFDLDTGDSNTVDFSFVVPYNAESGIYSLRLISYYNYKKSSDSYSRQSDPVDVKLNVIGGSSNATSATSAGITASLESEAKAGEDMTVEVTIKNLGSVTSTFIIDVTDYEDWATLNSISSRLVTLSPGESEDVEVSLKLDDNATGEQTFRVESRLGSKIESKEVAVTISDSSSFFSTIADSLASKPILWVIGVINLVLIILIIYFIVKIFRR